MEKAPSSTYQDELVWCIQQLEIGLLRRNASSKQVEDAQLALKVLRSQKAPMVRKRQVMKHMFGDYRQMMTKEREQAEKAAKKPMKAQIQEGDSKNSGSVAYKKCSEETSKSPGSWFNSSNNSFLFNFFPSGATDTLCEVPDAGGDHAVGTNCALQSKDVTHQNGEKPEPCEEGEGKALPLESGVMTCSLPGGQESEFSFNFAIPEEDTDRGMELSPEVTLLKKEATQQEGTSLGTKVTEAFSSEATEWKPGGQEQSVALDLVKAKTGTCEGGSKGVEETPRSSQKKKKKTKRAAEQSDAGKKPKPATSAESAKPSKDSEGSSLPTEEQLRQEVDWCVEQLELGLRMQKSSQKQVDEALRALKTLRSGKAPLVKKRQVMRAMFGDYRKKMEEERQRQLKLMQAASRSARIMAVRGHTKSKVFRRYVDISGREEGSGTFLASNAVGDRTQCTVEETFVFTPVQEEFRFNFF